MFGFWSCADMQVLVANIWWGLEKQDNFKNVQSEMILELFTTVLWIWDRSNEM